MLNLKFNKAIKIFENSEILKNRRKKYNSIDFFLNITALIYEKYYLARLYII